MREEQVVADLGPDLAVWLSLCGSPVRVCEWEVL